MPRPAQHLIRFTKEALDALPIPPKGKRAEYHDAKTPGLRVRITDRGHKSFCAVGWHKGKGEMVRETLGGCAALSIDQARRIAQQRLGQLAEGTDPRDERRRAKQRISLRELLDRYLEGQRMKKRRSSDEVASCFRRYIPAALERTLASDITRQDMTDLHAEVTRSGAPFAANRLLAYLSAAFNRALKAGVATSNPARNIEANDEVSRDRFIQPSEMSAFFRAVEAEANPTMSRFFLACLYTFQRRSDVMAMQWDHIETTDWLWHIPRTKNGLPHTVPILEEMRAILAEQGAVRESKFVFPGSGKTGHIAEPKAAWRRLTRRMECFIVFDSLVSARVIEPEGMAEWSARIIASPSKALAELRGMGESSSTHLPAMAPLRIHDLRRTGASYMALTNASLPVIGQALNHRSHQATEVYARFHAGAARVAMEASMAKMRSLLTPSLVPVD